ncbi:MAG: hypothetical protein PF961_05660 [Planctomycetota bacterium]|jgi:hypothetical protein|nr:hypothetical protein [Planctomycetota bacterium]
MIAAFILPAVLLAIATPLIGKLIGPDHKHRAAGILYLVASLAGGIAVALSFTPWGQATPLVLPGGIGLALPILAVIPLLWWWRGREPHWILDALIAVAASAAIGLLSFPWGNRGSAGWISLGAIALSAGVLTTALRSAAHGHLGSSLQWGLLAGAAAPVMLSLTNLGNAQALAQIMLPIAASAGIALLIGPKLLAYPGSAMPLAVVLTSLLGNAAIRYAPGSSDPNTVIWTLRLAGLGIILAPVLFTLSKRLPGRSGPITAWTVFVFTLAATAAAALWAYGYEADLPETTGPSWDYG